MTHIITVLPHKQNIEAPDGADLLSILRSAGLAPNAPRGGKGSCGKCAVIVDGKQALSCQTIVRRDMTVTVPEPSLLLHGGLWSVCDPGVPGQRMPLSSRRKNHHLHRLHSV